MMKKRLLFAPMLALISATALHAQLAIDSIEINTLKAHIYSDGGIEQMQTLDSSTYKNLLYADGLWLAGYDGTTLHQSSQTYRQSGLDFMPGPVSNDPNATANWNKVYRVNLQTLTDFKNGTTQGIPQEIANWPAHGDTTMGEVYYLAPFVDVNNDGHYKPADGDYPEIKGDEAIYTIFNDVNGRTTGMGLGVEVHAMLYGYRTGGVEDSILFREYRVINRSGIDYDDARVSIWSDFEVGNTLDDFGATSLETNSIYTYNTDSHDEGPYGFGNRPVAFGLRILQGPAAVFGDGFDNNRDLCVDGVRTPGGVCNPENLATGVREHILLSGSMYYLNDFSNQGNPFSPLEAYNYMQNKWRNGNNLIIEPNGDGYVTSNIGPISNYFFPGNSFDTSGAYEPSQPVNWSQTSQLNDPRFLSNMGVISLQAGEEFRISTAYVWARPDSSNDIFAPVNQLHKGLIQADSIYKNQPARTVGLKAYTAKQNYQLSYNTASAEWAIANGENRTMSFELYSTTGQLMQRFDVEGNSKMTIPTHSFSKGVYLLVEIMSGEAHKITR